MMWDKEGGISPVQRQINVASVSMPRWLIRGFHNYVPWPLPLGPIAVVARLHMPGIDLSSHNS